MPTKLAESPPFSFFETLGKTCEQLAVVETLELSTAKDSNPPNSRSLYLKIVKIAIPIKVFCHRTCVHFHFLHLLFPTVFLSFLPPPQNFNRWWFFLLKHVEPPKLLFLRLGSHPQVLPASKNPGILVRDLVPRPCGISHWRLPLTSLTSRTIQSAMFEDQWVMFHFHLGDFQASSNRDWNTFDYMRFLDGWVNAANVLTTLRKRHIQSYYLHMYTSIFTLCF